MNYSGRWKGKRYYVLGWLNSDILSIWPKGYSYFNLLSFPAGLKSRGLISSCFFLPYSWFLSFYWCYNPYKLYWYGKTSKYPSCPICYNFFFAAFYLRSSSFCPYCFPLSAVYESICSCALTILSSSMAPWRSWLGILLLRDVKLLAWNALRIWYSSSLWSR